MVASVKRQPMAGDRRKVIVNPLDRFETVEFAQRRKKNRQRTAIAKASRKKNRR